MSSRIGLATEGDPGEGGVRENTATLQAGILELGRDEK